MQKYICFFELSNKSGEKYRCVGELLIYIKRRRGLCLFSGSSALSFFLQPLSFVMEILRTFPSLFSPSPGFLSLFPACLREVRLLVSAPVSRRVEIIPCRHIDVMPLATSSVCLCFYAASSAFLPSLFFQEVSSFSLLKGKDLSGGILGACLNSPDRHVPLSVFPSA